MVYPMHKCPIHKVTQRNNKALTMSTQYLLKVKNLYPVYIFCDRPERLVAGSVFSSDNDKLILSFLFCFRTVMVFGVQDTTVVSLYQLLLKITVVLFQIKCLMSHWMLRTGERLSHTFSRETSFFPLFHLFMLLCNSHTSCKEHQNSIKHLVVRRYTDFVTQIPL